MSSYRHFLSRNSLWSSSLQNIKVCCTGLKSQTLESSLTVKDPLSTIIWYFMLFLVLLGLKNREERERQYFDTGLPATSSALMNEDVVEDDELYDRVSCYIFLWPWPWQKVFVVGIVFQLTRFDWSESCWQICCPFCFLCC